MVCGSRRPATSPAPIVGGTAFVELSAAKTSRSRIRPPFPVPVNVIKSMPSFFASRRARGVAIIRPCLFLETEERWGVTGSTSGWRDGS